MFRRCSRASDGPLGSAYLFTLSGVRSVLLNQWHSSTAADTQKLRSLVDSESITHLHACVHRKLVILRSGVHWASKPQPEVILSCPLLTLNKIEILLQMWFLLYSLFFYFFYNFLYCLNFVKKKCMIFFTLLILVLVKLN